MSVTNRINTIEYTVTQIIKIVVIVASIEGKI